MLLSRSTEGLTDLVGSVTKGFRATVYLRAPDGATRRISPNAGLFYQASINPDGTEVVFFGGTDGLPRIWRYVVGDRGGTAEAITSREFAARHPVYDWAGTRIAFASDQNAMTPGESIADINSATREVSENLKLNIFSANPDGTDIKQVTFGAFLDHRPCFSPDGRWIAFASNRSGELGIWRVRADGSQDPIPVFTDHWGYRPWYTASGESILFYGPHDDRHRIFEFSIGAGGARPLEADDQGMSHGPFVVPGRPETVVVHSTRGGSWGIWELPLHGRSPVREITPAGFPMAAHATISRSGFMVFDVKKS